MRRAGCTRGRTHYIRAPGDTKANACRSDRMANGDTCWDGICEHSARRNQLTVVTAINEPTACANTAARPAPPCWQLREPLAAGWR